MKILLEAAGESSTIFLLPLQTFKELRRFPRLTILTSPCICSENTEHRTTFCSLIRNRCYICQFMDNSQPVVSTSHLPIQCCAEPEMATYNAQMCYFIIASQAEWTYQDTSSRHFQQIYRTDTVLKASQPLYSSRQELNT